MAAGFSRPVAVVGLDGSGAEFAEDFLKRLGLLVEQVKLEPTEVNAFLRRGGLIIWIETSLTRRLSRLRRLGDSEDELRDLRVHERKERKMTLSYYRLPHEANPHYAWLMAHVIVHEHASGSRFIKLLRQLAAELHSGRLALLDRVWVEPKDEQEDGHFDFVLVPDRCGNNGLQVYEMGANPLQPL